MITLVEIQSKTSVCTYQWLKNMSDCLTQSGKNSAGLAKIFEKFKKKKIFFRFCKKLKLVPRSGICDP